MGFQSPGRPPAGRSGALRRRALGLAVLVIAPLLLVSGPPAQAEPDDGNLHAELQRLEERAGRLSEKYQGELVKLEDTKRTAERASARAERLRKSLDEARNRIGQLAARKYKNGGTSAAMQALMGGDPQSVLDRATTINYLARQDARRIGTVQRLSAQARQAHRQAQERIEDVQQKIDEMEQRKDKVQRLIERYEAEAADRAERAVSSAPGNITARMRDVNAEIVSRFGEGYDVHCYRPDDSGEHPEGRACDYMLSSGGAVPSDEQVQRGHEIAEWARSNAERLGIMYVIYRQRIWDARSGGGWESMEDRGGATANHVDHVHISVF